MMRGPYVFFFSVNIMEDQCTIYARHDQNTYTWVSSIAGDIACDTCDVRTYTCIRGQTVCCTPMYSNLGSQDEKELYVHVAPHLSGLLLSC